MTNNPSWQGTYEHLLIGQYYQLIIAPSAHVEFEFRFPILLLIKQTITKGIDFDIAIRDFLKKYPKVKYFLAGAAALIMILTIIEDILTFGAGIADDPASFALAWALIKAATR
ncbi:hypothetical protein [Microscilla marina]|uniref:hypothetical protein n=1 Tax=Microscilla marina TaxID=1027 RepID=UPI0012F9A665|nr:hypothetical protein [Microscilla marina]